MEQLPTTSRAKTFAAEVLAPTAASNDKEGRFPANAVASLGATGLLGLMVGKEYGGAGLGPRAFFEATSALAEADASVAMVYLMHVCGAMVIAAAPNKVRVKPVLQDIAAGKHLSTLAFSEPGSRSHFWAPISHAETLNGIGGVRITAKKSWVTSAGHANSYIVSALSPNAKGPTDSTLYLVPNTAKGLTVAGPWDGMGLRANGSAPMALDACEVPNDDRLTEDGTGFTAMLEVVLPLFNVGSAAVSLGICRAAVAATAAHLQTARFEHLGLSLGEALPTLRAQLAEMQIETDGLAARMDDVIDHLERPGELTMLRVLESKAAAGETAIKVTSTAMRTCGGAAFSKHTSVERFFRDAHAGAVMAPTGDVLREFIGKALLGIPLF